MKAASAAEEAEEPLNVEPSGMCHFDRYDVLTRCRELSDRLASRDVNSVPAWKWDILEFLDESTSVLREIQRANASPGIWQDIKDATTSDDASTLPVGLVKQCDEVLEKRERWLVEFDAELQSLVSKGKKLRERLLFDDANRGLWFADTVVNSGEVRTLLAQHLVTHQQAARLVGQMQTLCRALRQQGAMSSNRHAFQAKTAQDKLASSFLSLGTIMVTPMPGIFELWLASTGMMWLSSDEAVQHAVYEHPRGTETETILNQFNCKSSKARETLAQWSGLEPEKRKGLVLIHNASVRRVMLKTHVVSCIDGAGDKRGAWGAALEAHPLGATVTKAFGTVFGQVGDGEPILIGPQRMVVVQLPPKPDANWSWRGVFSLGETRVGETQLKSGCVFSFVAVDCGLSVGDKGDEPGEQVGDTSPRDSNSKKLVVQTPKKQDVSDAEDDGKGGHFTSVEVVNRMDDAVEVKIYLPGSGHPGHQLFRKTLIQGQVLAGSSRCFSIRSTKGEGKEEEVDDLDVQISNGRRVANCEVQGGQVIYVDGLFAG